MRSLLGVVHLLGSVVSLFSILFLVPIAMALVYHEAAIGAFVASAALTREEVPWSSIRSPVLCS